MRKGRFERIKDRVDRLGEPTADLLELAAADAGLLGQLASVGPAFLPGEPLELASAQARPLGLLTVGGPDRFPKLLPGKRLRGWSVILAMVASFVCDVRAGSYPPLHQGGSPPRNPKKRQKSSLEDRHTMMKSDRALSSYP